MSELPSVEVLETILHKCLEERDMEGVGHVLRLIAVQDPRRAGLLMDTLNVGLAIATPSTDQPGRNGSGSSMARLTDPGSVKLS